MKRLFRYSAYAVVAMGSFAFADGPKLNFEEHVLPVLRQHCLGCHQTTKARGDLNLETFTALMQGGSSGLVVESGDPDGSKLYTVTAHLAEPKMPPKSAKIPDKDIAIIKKWIADGLIEKSGAKGVESKKPKMQLAAAPVTSGKPAQVSMPADLLLEPFLQANKPSSILSIASSPWAPIVAVAVAKQVILYHSDTHELLGVLPFPEGMPNVVKFSRNGDLLMVAGGRAGQSGKAVVFNVKDGQRVMEVGNETDAILAADISADHSMIAVGTSSRLVRIYSTKTSEVIHSIKKHTEWVTAIAFSPDGVLLASGDRNSGLMVWESSTGREFYTLRGHTAAITDLSWRMDSNVLASGSEDSTIRLWEMQNGGQIKQIGAHGGGVMSVAYTHDSRLVSCGRDRVTKIWNPNGDMIKQLDPFNDVALRVSFSHDGKHIYAGDWTGDVRYWNSADGKLLGKLSTLPPAVAQALTDLQNQLKAASDGTPAKQQAYAAAEANAKKANDDLAATQKMIADLLAKAKADEGKQGMIKQAADQAKVALTAMQTSQTTLKAAETKLAGEAKVSKDNWEKAGAEAKILLDQLVIKQKAAQDALASSTSAQQAAGKMPGEKAIIELAKSAKDLSDKMANVVGEAKKLADGKTAEVAKLAELVAAKKAEQDKTLAELAKLAKSIPEQDALIKKLDGELAAQVALVAKTKAEHDAATKLIPAKTEAVKNAGNALAAAKGQLDGHIAEAKRLGRQLAKYEAAKINNVLAKAKSELAAEQAKHEELIAAVTAVQTDMNKVSEDIKATEKLVADAPNLVKQRQAEIDKQKAVVAEAQKAEDQATAIVKAKEALLAQSEAAKNAIKAAADQDKANQALAQSLVKLTEAATLLTADVNAAKQAHQAKKVVADQAKAQQKSIEDVLVKLQTDVAAAPKKIESLKASLNPMTEKLKVAQAASDKFAQSNIAPAKAKVDQLAKDYALANQRYLTPTAN